MVPHIAEELWSSLGNSESISNETWPKVDFNYIQENSVRMPIQINGKVRSVIEVPLNLNEKDLEDIALKEENVSKFLNTKPKKIIIVPNRVVNFVI